MKLRGVTGLRLRKTLQFLCVRSAPVAVWGQNSSVWSHFGRSSVAVCAEVQHRSEVAKPTRWKYEKAGMRSMRDAYHMLNPDEREHYVTLAAMMSAGERGTRKINSCESQRRQELRGRVLD
eukprot:6345426-Amphidinium_carterae.1